MQAVTFLNPLNNPITQNLQITDLRNRVVQFIELPLRVIRETEADFPNSARLKKQIEFAEKLIEEISSGRYDFALDSVVKSKIKQLPTSDKLEIADEVIRTLHQKTSTFEEFNRYFGSPDILLAILKTSKLNGVKLEKAEGILDSILLEGSTIRPFISVIEQTLHNIHYTPRSRSINLIAGGLAGISIAAGITTNPMLTLLSLWGIENLRRPIERRFTTPNAEIRKAVTLSSLNTILAESGEGSSFMEYEMALIGRETSRLSKLTNLFVIASQEQKKRVANLAITLSAMKLMEVPDITRESLVFESRISAGEYDGFRNQFFELLEESGAHNAENDSDPHTNFVLYLGALHAGLFIRGFANRLECLRLASSISKREALN